MRTLRVRLAELMRSGAETDWRQRAYTDPAIRERLEQLQSLEPSDYAMKLKIAGFTTRPYHPPERVELEQSCATCMYYARHRKYCELPELDMPVLPRWSCVLWRI
jgi:hypothetical protein